LRVVCLADTHGLHEEVQVPEGDLLIHAGDVSMGGTEEEIEAFDAWMARLPHPHKVLIAGNHDWLFQRDPEAARRRITSATYLQDSGVSIGSLRLWGSPWQPWFMNWAFNLRRGRPLEAIWQLIPEHTEILITHCPPHGILDAVSGFAALALSLAVGQGTHVGCRELATAVKRVRPRLHVFGHIHEGYGRQQRGDTTFVNASVCDAHYRPTNSPVVVDL
jgi:Icc-related predicted phosphoesterase